MSETAKKKSPGRIVLTVVCAIVGVVLLILLAARLYFRIPVHEYYANSEKTFVIPGLSDGMIVQWLRMIPVPIGFMSPATAPTEKHHRSALCQSKAAMK